MPKTPKRNGPSIEVASVLGGGSSARIKKKIRDIERLLKKDKLPATVRTDNERALKALRVELDNANFNHRTQKIAQKYHMVRFFEKKKAVRKLKQARKHMNDLVQKEAERKDIKKARKVVRHCEIDLIYVVLFPKHEKYISLYPNDAEEPLDENAKKGLQATEDRKREFRKECERLLDEDAVPFNFEEVAAGKTVVFKSVYGGREREDIDKPEEGKEEEDDFFE